MQYKRRALSLFLIIVLGASAVAAYISSADVQEERTEAAAAIEASELKRGYGRENSYEQYMENYKEAAAPDYTIRIPAASYTKQTQAEMSILNQFEGVDKALKLSNDNGWVEWTVNIPETGLYEMALRYYPLEGMGRPIELGLAMDGVTPFTEARSMLFQRIWKDDGAIKQDSQGNDYSPGQIEAPAWIEQDFRDAEGLYKGPFQFHFTKGTHTIRLNSIREPVVLDALKIYKKAAIPTYADVHKQYRERGYQEAAGEIIKLQAEKSYLKSDQTLRPAYDRSSPLTEPMDIAKIRLNIIGQQNWSFPGQWIKWKFEVPEDGLYKLGFKYQQSYIRGFFTNRSLYIDGKIPFQEAAAIQFPYGSDWTLKVPGDDEGEPYLFYLTKGTHELAMEVVLGEITTTIRHLEQVVYDLNEMYRKMLMITSTQPDIYRDYALDKEIPGLLETLRRNSTLLAGEAGHIERILGQKGSEATLLATFAEQLTAMVDYPDTIPQRLDHFKSNISAISQWMLDIRSQPLDLDYLVIMPAAAKAPKAKAGFFQTTAFEARSFFSSFFHNYSLSGEEESGSETITLWLSWGRDQAQVLNTMINDMFTPQTGIQVKVKLVQASSIQAVLSNEGPDVSIMVGRGQPVNLAIRGALTDLSAFEDFTEVKKRFMDEATVPYALNGGVYGLPDTETFYMMFYRKDIFEELGIDPPQTWSDVYNIAPVIQRNNMQIGMPYTSVDAWEMVDQGMGTRNLFPSLLYQNNGAFYEKQGTGLRNDPKALTAFKQWTDFYAQYSFPMTYDFYNRFRTGEMPLAIAPYSEYNRLTAAAPEIRNLWEMVPIPGSLRENGTIDHATGGSGTAAIIYNRSKHKEASWQFLKWWTGAEAQERYAKELESLMGTAARQPVANVEAFGRLPWTKSELERLMEQWRQVREIREVPGGYYTVRSLDNAFRDVVIHAKNPRESLNKRMREADEEIMRKRDEFGLE
ncbi:ABC transporter substrate-binding protein [Paenibacillus baekrokdamisoli]|uniref:ABC transporter substrate-binding protein n=1 Tax=Paenibacillus baekrokdamisoli TaxID=1712516 RepID=A0A3G9II59_9BACL|nr:extracellular solute-binding protein [Paenibacillus baekrokdamisoli]MBB3069375.1 ABC-type glycerol-3-phosphate transport system substrate-binding protein [Paenibacillus baekrokdamisoli]BBH18657.1 ABC transporter substrate-binding protein [Paenibacillus baekrokdamisoli]